MVKQAWGFLYFTRFHICWPNCEMIYFFSTFDSKLLDHFGENARIALDQAPVTGFLAHGWLGCLERLLLLLDQGQF